METPEIESVEEVYDHWWEAVPAWLWILVGGTVVIFVMSMTVRLLFEEGPVRLWWTVGQMTLGIVALFIAHLLAYMYGSSRSDRVGPLDALLKPLATWQPVLRSLPQKSRLLWTGVWSLTSVVFAYFVIDGIDAQALAEARRQEVAEESKERTNPMAIAVRTAATMARAQDATPTASSEQQTIEDALSELTGDPAIAEMNGDAQSESGEAGNDGSTESRGDADSSHPNDADAPVEEQQQLVAANQAGGHEQGEHTDRPSPEDAADSDERDKKEAVEFDATITAAAEMNLPSESIECVVFGYTTNASGEPRSLLLATAINQRLAYVAKVPLERVDPEALQGILEQLPDLQQPRPVVSSPYGGRWLKPEIFCDVRYSAWTAAGRLVDPYVNRIAVVPGAAEEEPDSVTAVP